MLARNTTAEVITAAAEAAGVRIGGYRGIRPAGRGLRFTLATLQTGDAMRYGRRGFRGRRLPGRVCWHGHRAFMRELFARSPDCILKTALATYRGREAFEREHVATFTREAPYVGFTMPAAAALPCDCAEGAPDVCAVCGAPAPYPEALDTCRACGEPVHPERCTADYDVDEDAGGHVRTSALCRRCGA